MPAVRLHWLPCHVWSTVNGRLAWNLQVRGMVQLQLFLLVGPGHQAAALLRIRFSGNLLDRCLQAAISWLPALLPALLQAHPLAVLAC